LTSLDGTHYYYDDTTETNEIDPNDLEGEELYEESPYVLIIDQFEEIVTTHPDRWQEREGFFRQLAQAMADDPMLWVVLTLREDYIAPLDPYTHLLPGKLRARFYMQRMDHEAALEAVRRPAANYGRPFAPGVAESLVDNLRQIRVRSAEQPDQVGTTSGQFIEPVQLQVVCFQMWENLKHRPLADITQQDLVELGDVDKALGQFYEQALTRVLAQVNVSEIELRNWFESQLITEAGTKGTVYQGAELTGGIPNNAVTMLADQYLLRAEVRAGGTWYELVHDRLVLPILQANQAWRLEQPLLQIAQAWIEADRNPAMLLEKQQLKRALEGNWRGLGPQVEEFLEASQTAQRGKDEARRIEHERLRQQELEQAQALAEEQRKRAEIQAEATASLRRRAWLLGIFFAVGVIMAIVAVTFGILANRSRAIALENANLAATESARAIAAQQTAQTEATAAALNADAYQNVLQNQNATQTAEAESMMDQNQAEAQELALQANSLEATITAESELYASAAEETATSELPTELPTPSNTSDPPTPEAIYTATATPTSTPDRSPTQTAEARATELAGVRVEQTRMAEQVAAPIQECQIEAQGPFSNIATRFQERLGCPNQAEPTTGFFAEQPFQNGAMYWSSILELFFVLLGDLQEGQWRVFTKAEVDTFNPNPDGVACEATVPEGLVQPIRGFGAIWCAQAEFQRAIGFATQDEFGVSNNLLQIFENGYILRDNQTRTFVLFDNGTYLRVE
ncbi:MAG: hypothetical protein KDF65_04385, partial [Anaerolineae bacterium]|nr:hypothetical protein [Anaerolineae bacterium]